MVMNSTTPLITVLMATYNDKVEFLSKAIESILYQTYSNFELLICDDSTQEDTIDLLNSYAAVDKRIRLIRKEKKMGFVNALNEGLRQARGEWIARMDGDDISFKNRLEEEIKYIGEDVGVISSQCINIDANGTIMGNLIKTPLSDFTIKLFLILGKNPIVHPAALINRNIFVKLGGYDGNISVSEDYDAWLRIQPCAKIVNIPKPLIYYRVHGNNAHILKIDVETGVLCCSLIKYASRVNTILSSQRHQNLLCIVKNENICRLIHRSSNNKAILLLKILKIYPNILFLILFLKYRYFKKIEI